MNPSVPQIKSKTDPEALLNDLSASLKSFSSTVREWTASNDANRQAGFVGGGGGEEMMVMRPGRLGLGAKAVRNPQGPNDTVTTNLLLKKQLTGNNYKNNDVSNSKTAKSTFKGGKTQIRVQKSTLKDEEEGGRASMISKKCRK